MASTLPSVSLQGGLSKSSSEPACRICAEVSRKVLKAIEEGPHDTYGLGWDQPEFDRIDLGNQTAFKSRLGCATCQNLMWYFKVHQKAGLKINSITHHLVISIQLSPMHLYFGMENCWGPYWTGSKGMVIKLLLESPRCAPQHLLQLKPDYACFGPYPFDPRSGPINLDMVREWSEDCAVKHSLTCLDPHIQPPRWPMTVIDVKQNCLVTLPECSRYMALSYVWGHSGSLATAKKMEALRKPGSLNGASRVFNLPATIRDAIHLTSELKINYLWVDRLCIIQDSKEDMDRQLNQMAQIYENAFITVVAVDGEDADHGLRGIGGPSQLRQYRPRIFPFSPKLELRSANDEEEEEDFLHKWHMRAWTFQERAISRRKLIFVDGTIYWECRVCKKFEIDSNRLGGFIRMGCWPHHMVERANFPDLRTYFDLVEGYNHRHLTQASDAQRAFSAVLDFMSSGFPGGFHFGIPEFCFDIGLLWIPSGEWPLSRRSMFPSWSWMGWAGPVDLPGYFRLNAWKIEQKDRVCNPLVTVKPTTLWKKVTQHNKLARISNTYSDYQNFTHRRLSSQTRLPKGWTYETRSPEERGFLAESVPNKLFNFPFPIVGSTSNSTFDKSSPRLQFDTRTCKLRVRVYGCLQRAVRAKLEDAKGAWAGVVRFDSGALSSKFCSFIEISKFSIFGRVEGMLEYEEFDCKNFYNVLLVEEKGGIKYRRGLGRVPVKIWERQNLEKKTVVLG